jgi:propionyl-CoA carboxylase alpha chain
VFAPLLSSVEAVRLSCLAAALAGAAGRRRDAAVQRCLPSGWRNAPSTGQTIRYDGPAGPVEVGYRLDRSGRLAAWWVRPADPPADPDGRADDHPPVAIWSAAPDRVVLAVAGMRVAYRVHRVAGNSYVDSADGSVTLVELPRFPAPAVELNAGSLTAPLPGAVSRVLVRPGQRVAAGERLMTLEAMKLEHPVHAPTAGRVTSVPVNTGDQVDTGTVLAVITPE